MERTFSPMIRHFSTIEGLQQAYTLVYSLDADGEDGCRLTLCRTGSGQRMDSCYVAAARSSATGSCAICVRMAFSQRSGRMWWRN